MALLERLTQRIAGDGNVALIVGVADWHTNSTLGLNPPSIRREFGSTHVVGKVGRANWRSWNEFWDIVDQKRAEYDATVYTFAAGDLGDLNTHSNVQLISQNETDIKDAMAEVADVMSRASDYVFVLRGTESHTGENGRLEEWLARDLDNAAAYDDRIASWWVADPDIAGFQFLITHHPPTSSRRSWTLHPAIARSVNIVVNRYMDAGKMHRKPDLCMWAHLHTQGGLAYGQTGTVGIWLPPWQLHTGYAHRLGVGAGPRCVGGFWMTVKSGKILDWEFERWWPKKGAPWTTP